MFFTNKKYYQYDSRHIDNNMANQLIELWKQGYILIKIN